VAVTIAKRQLVQSQTKGDSMKFGAIAVSCLLVSSVFGLGCSRNRQEAVLLANEGDKAVKVDVDNAISKYEQASKLDPTSHPILYKMAMAYRKKEDWEKAASTLSRATQLAPKYANYWFYRGHSLEMQAKKKTISYQEAREPFQKCIESDPNYAECYAELGTVYLWSDDEQKAIENFTKAIEHNPTEISYYAQLADLYIRLGLYKEAESVLKEAKSFAKPGDKDLFGIHMLLSSVYQERKSMSEMVAELEAAKSVASAESGDAVLILFSLGSTYAQLDPPRKQEAINMLKGFNARACKGAKAQLYKTECETTQTLVTKVGGTLQ
jgi:tetratricopeptide (TPR) repeat protein